MKCLTLDPCITNIYQAAQVLQVWADVDAQNLSRLADSVMCDLDAVCEYLEQSPSLKERSVRIVEDIDAACEALESWQGRGADDNICGFGSASDAVRADGWFAHAHICIVSAYQQVNELSISAVD